MTSFLALRKLDDFPRATKAKADDLISSDFGIDVATVLGDVGANLLSTAEREKINKEAAHLTERLALDHDSEVDLKANRQPLPAGVHSRRSGTPQRRHRS
jgi:hypothetical protein